MSVSEASETLASRKKMRFTVPPANLPVRFWEESEDNYDSMYGLSGDNSEDESQHDQEHSESDGNDEGQDEEEHAEEENQYDQEHSESVGDEEEMQNAEEEQVEEESQSNEQLSDSDADEERQDGEEEQMEEQSQSNQERLESDADEAEMLDAEVEQVAEESQSNQERSESDDDEEWQGVEEEQVEMENERNQAPLESSGDEEEQQEQGEDVPEDGGFQKGSSEPALAAPLSKRTMIANMTLDEDLLDCGVCFLPLKPPIFQCDVGHVVCSSCRNKLAATGRCHMCCTPLSGGYRRCHAMEQLLESIRGSCPNAPYGCTVRMAYYDQHAHLQVCRHAPCHCPAEACGFIGSTASLHDHFVVAHKWPLSTGVEVSKMRDTTLHDGFNVFSVVHDARQYLFLLIVARTPLGRAISCLCIHPPQVAAADSLQLASKNVKWRMKLFYSHNVWKGADDYVYHHQHCSFKVACTDLSSGMPDPDECFQFIVPSSVQPDAEATVQVMADFSIQ